MIKKVFATFNGKEKTRYFDGFSDSKISEYITREGGANISKGSEVDPAVEFAADIFAATARNQRDAIAALDVPAPAEKPEPEKNATPSAEVAPEIEKAIEP